LGFGTRSEPSGSERRRALGVPEDVQRGGPGLLDQRCGQNWDFRPGSGAERVEVKTGEFDLG